MPPQRKKRRDHQYHGLSRHPFYPVWNGMLDRCENPDSTAYHRYGGRGITVCSQWHSAASFIGDIERLLGPRPEGCSLDRIDNDQGYEPGNVRWATAVEQSNNRRQHDASARDGANQNRDTADKRWLPVPGYQGWYEVSCDGDVYSLGRSRARSGLLTPQVNSAGYRFVRLCKYGHVRSITVGRLVLLAFRGPASGRRAMHGPGGSLDDRLENLHWK